MRKALGIRVLCLSLLALIALGFWWLWFGDSSRDGVYSGPVSKLVIGNIGEFSVLNLIADERGFFARHGLDAQIREFAAGPDSLSALIAGELDVAVAADFVGVNTLFTHPELRILAQASKHETFSLVARRDRGVATPADLKGRRIGVTRGSAGELYLNSFLTRNQLSIADVDLRDLAPDALVSDMKDGSLDAVLAFSPHVYLLERDLRDAVVVWPAQDTQKTFALLYTTKERTEFSPEVLERYLEALFEAETYLREYPVDTRDLIARRMGYAPEYVDYTWSSTEHSLALDQALVVAMESQAAWLLRTKPEIGVRIPNYLDAIYFAGLDVVRPDRVRIIH